MQLNNTSCSYFAVSFYFIVNGTTPTLLLAPPPYGLSPIAPYTFEVVTLWCKY